MQEINYRKIEKQKIVPSTPTEGKPGANPVKGTARNTYSLFKLGKVEEKLGVLMKLAGRAPVEFRPQRRDYDQVAAIFLEDPMRLRKLPQEADKTVGEMSFRCIVPSCKSTVERAPFRKAVA